LHQIGVNAAAAVVPNPTLSGECKWGSNNTTTTTIIKGATPTGVTLANAYGRCNGVADGSLIAANYGNAEVPSWPPTSYQEKTYSGVKPNLDCGNATPTPTSSQTCDPLTVVDALTACRGEEDLNTLCPNVDWNDIKWGMPAGTPVNSGCYYVQNISGNVNFNVNNACNNCFKLNGVNRSTQVNDNSLPERIDGGYYIHLPNTATWRNGTTTMTSKPFCAGGPLPTLTCALPTNGWVGYPVYPMLTCSDGSTPELLNATGIDFDNPTGGNHNGSSISVSAMCGPANVTANSCSGTLNVSSTQPETYDWNGYKADVEGTYILGEVCTSAQFKAYCGNSAGCTLTVDGVIYKLNQNNTRRWSIGTFLTGQMITFENMSQVDCNNN